MDEVNANAAHLNARIRGKMSHLLTRSALDKLLDLPDVERLVEALLETPYKPELAESLTHLSGADAIEDALSRNLVETFQGLLRAAQGDMRGPAKLFLMRWDLAGVKSLLRNRHHGLTGDESLASLMPGPTLSQALLHSFAEKGSMDELVSALVSWNLPLCGPLAQHLSEYHESNSVEVLEDALDRAYFVQNMRRLRSAEDESSQLLRRVLRIEIDRINFRLILQHKQSDTDASMTDGRLLPGGFVNMSVLREMAAARDAADAMELLGSTKYAELVERLSGLIQTGHYGPMDRLFELLMIRYLRRMSHERVMSLAILMYFAWLKYNEVINIRMIARGHAHHLTPGRVREEVMYA